MLMVMLFLVVFVFICVFIYYFLIKKVGFLLRFVLYKSYNENIYDWFYVD